MAMEIPNVLGMDQAAPAPTAPTSGHPHLAAILSRLAPILAATVAGHHAGPEAAGGLLHGFQQRQAALQAEQEKQQQLDQARTDRIAQQGQQRSDRQAEFRMKALETLAGLDDPGVFTQVAKQLDDIGASNFGLPPGAIKNNATFSDARKLKTDQEDAQALVDAMQKQYGAREVFDMNPLVSFHGKSMLFQDLVDLAGLAARVDAPVTPPDGSGPAPKPVPGPNGVLMKPPPPKPPTEPQGSETERIAKLRGQIRAARGAGDTAKATTLQAEYDDILATHKAMNEAGRAPAAGAAGGGLTEDGSDYAATVFRITGKMPALGNGGQAMKTAIINKAAAQAKLLGQSPAVSIQKQAAYKADGAALTKMKTMSAAAESFETKALAQAEIVVGLSDKVSRTQYPIINRALLAGQANIAGDPNTQLLFNAVTTFTTEYAKIMEGSTGSAAGSSDSARRAAADLISSALNKGTLRATVELMKREMGLTIDGYGATIAHIEERMGGAPPEPPAATPSNRLYYDSNGNPTAAPK